MLIQQAVHLDTDRYQHFFGQKPAGEGTWLFYFDDNRPAMVLTGKFEELKWRAIGYAKMHGHRRVEVNTWV